MKIHLMVDKIDTVLSMATTSRKAWRNHRSPEGKKVYSYRLLTFDTNKSPEKVLAGDNPAKSLKDSDPEFDIESAGLRVRTNNIVVDSAMKPVYTYKAYDVLVKPDGKQIERPHMSHEPNVNATLPVRVTDKMADPAELMTRYIFRKSYFITHHDGTSYKFLYELATSLASKKQFARLMAYDPEAKKAAPLILSSIGTPFPAAFLEGRVDGDKYCLIMHLADREFKIPDKEIEEPGDSDAGGTPMKSITKTSDGGSP